MNHFIFTKFNMPGFDGDPHIDPGWLDFRIMLLKKWLLPSLKQQTCQDFKWFIHAWHKMPMGQATDLLEIGDSYDNLEILWLHNKNWHAEWLEKIRDRVEPGLLLTTRIDSDDAVHREFVDRVQNLHISPGYFFFFHAGIMHDCKNGTYYERQYFRNPFLSRLETSYSDAPRDIATVHARQHCHAEPVECIEWRCPMWVQNVHGGNQGNRYDPPNGKEFDFSKISKNYIGE